ncbi:MAG TPA: energy transducer TonB [Microscillaceae bacterium]|nr:energy transducer TonB [Microscillaceae bacterium]
MQEKKYLKVDTARQSGLFLNIGLCVSLLVTIVAFEWKSPESLDIKDISSAGDIFEEQIEIPSTEQPPPPPPTLQQPEVIEVPNEEKIEEEIKFNLSSETVQKVEKVTTIKKEIKKVEEKPKEEVDEVFEIVEDKPEPEGGMEKFYKYVAKELKYPASARRMGIEGKVYIQFIVDKDGTLTDVKVVKGISEDCDEEAVRVIKKAPAWKPGKQRGRPVKVKMVIPIVFKLS